MTDPRKFSEGTKGTLFGDKPFPPPSIKEKHPIENLPPTADTEGRWTASAGSQATRAPVTNLATRGVENLGSKLYADSFGIYPSHSPQNPQNYASGKKTSNNIEPVKEDDHQQLPGITISEEPKQPKTTEREAPRDPVMAVNMTKILPPHLRKVSSPQTFNSIPPGVPKVEAKPGLVVASTDPQQEFPKTSHPAHPDESPSTTTANTAQATKKNLSTPQEKPLFPSPVSRHPPSKSLKVTSPVTPLTPAAAPHGAGAWANLAGSSGPAVNRPARFPNAYSLPARFSGNTYGSPRSPRPIPAATNIDPAMERTLFFKSWPGVEDRGTKAMPRTIIISNLPQDPTLAMISSICKDTGLIESISLIPSVGKAMVWYIEATDAQKLFDRSGNGIEFSYSRGGKTHKSAVFIDMKKDLDILASAMRTNVTDKGHTRVIRIVGWVREDLERLTGAKGAKDEPYGVLLKRLAEKCTPEGKADRLEGVTTEINSLGHNEARLIFGGIKEAYYALGQLLKKAELEACNVTFGRDPCEPEVVPRV